MARRRFRRRNTRAEVVAADDGPSATPRPEPPPGLVLHRQHTRQDLARLAPVSSDEVSWEIACSARILVGVNEFAGAERQW
jgi:hypothetical protein